MCVVTLVLVLCCVSGSSTPWPVLSAYCSPPPPAAPTQCLCLVITSDPFTSPPPSLQITMARGKTRGHKGGRKQFSTADQIKDDIAKAEERRKWREQHPDSDSEEESEEEQKQSRSKVSPE